MSRLQNSWMAIDFPALARFRTGTSAYGTTMPLIPAQKQTQSGIATHPPGALPLAPVKKEAGFTLIEVLMSMALFALLISAVYGALGPAGEGFIQLKQTRDRLEKSHWLGRQLRLDMSYLSATEDSQIRPVRISHDARGDAVFDELWILGRESNQPSLTYIHYFLDEERGKLIRESRMAWARTSVDALQWEMGEAESFDVELLTQEGQWAQRWETGEDFKWPKAVRITYRDESGEREWDFPLFVGQVAQ